METGMRDRGANARPTRGKTARRDFVPFGVRLAAYRGVQIVIALAAVSIAVAALLLLAAD
jgi:hypothetical protein